VSLDAFLVEQIRAAVREELAAALAPLREDLREMRPPRYVPRAEAARLTNCSLPTLDRRISRNEIAVKRLGRRVLVDVESLRVPSDEEVAEMAARARLGLTPALCDSGAGGG
jgi:excisionase family DNA binding protein